MSIWSRLKSLAGGHGTLATLTSATTLYVPSDDNAYYLSGSATITSLVSEARTRTRKVTFVGATSASVTFTHTASASTANQMNLGGGNIVLGAGHVLELLCKENGVWIVIGHSTGAGDAGGGGESATLASATTTAVPDSGDIHVITGTATITALTATALRPFRKVTLIGGSSASVTFTNTNSPAATQMFLQGANVVLNEQDVIVLIQQADTSWFLESTSAA